MRTRRRIHRAVRHGAEDSGPVVQTTPARQATPQTDRVSWSVRKGRSMKGQRKKQACKKTGCGREGIKTERPEIARKEGASTTYLQVLWRKSPIWPATLSGLGGQTVVLMEKTTIAPNAASPLRETGRMV